MSEVTSQARSITAEIAYLNKSLDRLVIRSTARPTGEQIIERHGMPVCNGRVTPPSLAQEGFEIATWPSRVVRERREELIESNLTSLRETPQVNIDYWDETLPLIHKLSGAREVVAMHGTTVRFSPRQARKNSWTAPAGWCHLDFEPDEVARLVQEALERDGRRVRPYSRFMLIQGWRPLSLPPQDIPLAVCDGRTVKTADIIPLEFHVVEGDRDQAYRSRGGHYSARHRWFYFPDMTPDEMIVFKGFDSAQPETMNPLHVSFEDRTVTNPVPRISVESRFFALFD